MNEMESGQYRSEEERRAAEEFNQNAQESREANETEKPKPFDAIIVLGCGPVQKPLNELQPEKFTGPGWQMNMDAKMRTIAAGQAYVEGLTRKIILTGGKTGGAELQSESETMKRMLIKKFKVPEDAIIIEDRSTNTVENFANVMNIIDKAPENFQSIAVLSNEYHVARARLLAEQFSQDAQGIGAESLLSRRSRRYDKILEKYFSSAEYQDKLKGEVRWTRGIQEIPLYLLPQAMAVENPSRLRLMLETEKVQETVDEILREQGIEGGLDELKLDTIEDIDQLDEILEQIRGFVGDTDRRMPPPEWATLEQVKESEKKTQNVKIFLARHGESTHNIAEVPYFAGGSLEQDADLSPKGIESAKKVAEQLKKEGIDVLICSDLKRSRQTAEVIAQTLDQPIEIVSLEGLREVHVGELTGKTREQVRLEGTDEAKKALELFLSGDIRQINFPGGDTYETACKRVKTSLEKIIQEHGDIAKIAIVGHGNINKVILSLMFPDDFDFINQLNLSHENVVELNMDLDERNQPQFKDVRLYGEGESKGLI